MNGGIPRLCAHLRAGLSSPTGIAIAEARQPTDSSVCEIGKGFPGRSIAVNRFVDFLSGWNTESISSYICHLTNIIRCHAFVEAPVTPGEVVEIVPPLDDNDERLVRSAARLFLAGPLPHLAGDR